MPFERRRETKVLPQLFEGIHINPVVLEDEWVNGNLITKTDSKRYKDVRRHLDLCEHCQSVVAEARDHKHIPPDRKSAAAGGN